jgi:hypothetical protein
MTEAIAKIAKLERGVLSRQRLLSVADGVALALGISALALAIIVVVARLRPISLPLWPVIIAGLSLSILTAIAQRFLTRSSEKEAAFLIDRSLNLDDRIATSRLIIQRGGPANAFEEALIQDAAHRLGTHRSSSLVPLKARRWHAVSLVSVAVLAATLMISPRSIPVNQSLVAERADIESAGEHLEQTAAEVAQAVAPGTETASLANEQAELGRAFRSSSATRSEALRRLTALEERIQKRHDELSNTRADEIVSLADRRLGSALSTAQSRPAKIEADESQQPIDERSAGPGTPPGKGRSGVTPSGALGSAESSPQSAGKLESPSKGGQRTQPAKAGEPNKTEPQKRPQEPVPGQEHQTADARAKNERGLQRDSKNAAVESSTSPDQKAHTEKTGDQPTSDQKADDRQTSNRTPNDPSKGDSRSGADQKTDEQKTADQKATETLAGSDLLKAVPGSLAQEAAKRLPKLSAELLKKAAELRANELTPSDIEKLRKAAESLARDLNQIEQSRELQKALQEMARQVRPEQIEQVARELGNQEGLKQELEAAGRLLSQNQRGKEIVTGLAEQFADAQEERRRGNQRDDGKSGMRNGANGPDDLASRSNQTNGSAGQAKAAADGRLEGQGKQATLKGKLQQGSAGQYLFLQSRAGTGAARAPYSSVYPQYRREAERSVQRSQVPPNLRSVVRKYFDAINPDGKK